jgi:hypothetical protein
MLMFTYHTADRRLSFSPAAVLACLLDVLTDCLSKTLTRPDALVAGCVGKLFLGLSRCKKVCIRNS